MHIRRLAPSDAAVFHSFRLDALRESPSAFGSSYEEEAKFTASAIESRLESKPDQGVFGAFKNEMLVGLTGLGRENLNKLSHKAFIWGMYVSPSSRGQGISRTLLTEALSFAHSVPEILQVNLCVNANNVNAFRLYESAGFKVFGREPGAMLINGELHDEVHMYLRFTHS